MEMCIFVYICVRPNKKFTDVPIQILTQRPHWLTQIKSCGDNTYFVTGNWKDLEQRWRWVRQTAWINVSVLNEWAYMKPSLWCRICPQDLWGPCFCPHRNGGTHNVGVYSYKGPHRSSHVRTHTHARIHRHTHAHLYAYDYSCGDMFMSLAFWGQPFFVFFSILLRDRPFLVAYV